MARQHRKRPGKGKKCERGTHKRVCRPGCWFQQLTCGKGQRVGVPAKEGGGNVEKKPHSVSVSSPRENKILAKFNRPTRLREHKRQMKRKPEKKSA